MSEGKKLYICYNQKSFIESIDFFRYVNISTFAEWFMGCCNCFIERRLRYDKAIRGHPFPFFAGEEELIIWNA